jgi:hypothetical protein
MGSRPTSRCRESGGSSPWRVQSEPPAKRMSQQQNHSWSIYRLRGTPAQLIGIIHNQADEQSAIESAIAEFKIPENQRNRLIARRLE